MEGPESSRAKVEPSFERTVAVVKLGPPTLNARNLVVVVVASNRTSLSTNGGCVDAPASEVARLEAPIDQ
jgi:hypothetical protein